MVIFLADTNQSRFKISLRSVKSSRGSLLTFFMTSNLGLAMGDGLASSRLSGPSEKLNTSKIYASSSIICGMRW